MKGRELSIVMRDPALTVPLAAHQWLAEHLGKVGHVLGLHGAIRVYLADDAEMSRVHRDYMGIEQTTDVITFNMSESSAKHPKPHPGDLGSSCGSVLYGIDTDIWVGVDEARRQALVGGYPFERELLLYLVHGILHCLGWDDHDEDEAQAMHGMEDAVLSAIGVGPVYRRP
ncbi:MAG: hypothetical protein HBSAPP03_09410 [Phycisphaerae bacterium]|nr:MAG: hypothetical protein HBSAPP03_09410 [Phycisphaerae bacterium]